MSRISIRAARVSDVVAVLDFWRLAAEGTSITDDVAGVTRLVERDPDALILAKLSAGAGDSARAGDSAQAGDPARLVGTVIAGWDGWRSSLYRLAVHPDHRRQGISKLLLDAAHERFRTVGGRRADAMVLEANGTGQAAWAAAGYHREDHWRRWVKPLG
ncbi:GNAT family N-acetyltransferase [Streptacidiphilus sp. NEAU-YB345]|uniref:GNAT family N-acetyltransferase n=1 Tax=Streptacidiphilus fuscans TaxID=2789292 RepID=A0A931B7F8_9ACTN|nr:GNAT family N-acetyltransferase [Streptacidiphilus fuscans]MBF9070062.1 GNAT family N-acetyltransferase [Streptacidiphilus fuscans]